MIKLLNNYILVKHAEEKLKEGFNTVSAINELIGKGEVIAVPETTVSSTFGNGFPPIGSTVWFEKSLGTEFIIDGQKVKFIKVEDVMGFE